MQMTYQVCVVDPEGDYGTLRDMLTLGNQHHAVTVSEVLAMLEDPKLTLNVNLLGIPLSDRPQFFGQVFPSLQAMRTRTGRPHWIVLDEAHHMLPAEWSPIGNALPQTFGETILVTVHPDHVARQAWQGSALLLQWDRRRIPPWRSSPKRQTAPRLAEGSGLPEGYGNSVVSKITRTTVSDSDYRRSG